MKVRIPENMNSVDVFIALYESAEVFGVGAYNPVAGQDIFNHINAIQIFKNYCFNGNCRYVRGKYMKVSFRKFPELNVERYDNHYGPRSAQKAIDTYHKTMKKKHPKEEYDLNCSPCTYFSSYYEQVIPAENRVDLKEEFRRCKFYESNTKLHKPTKTSYASPVLQKLYTFLGK